MSERISHSGIIDSILGENIKVRIVQTSACAACKVASHCNAAESKVKVVDVICADSTAYRVGQEVVVSASKAVANRALLLGFGLPFLILVAVLLLLLRLAPLCLTTCSCGSSAIRCSKVSLFGLMIN